MSSKIPCQLPACVGMVLVRVAVCIVLFCVLYLYLFNWSRQVNRHSLLKKKKKRKEKKKPRSLRYIDTDFRWADSRCIRYNRFYVIANYVISVVTCIHFKWSSAGPRRGLRNNRELRYIGLRYIDSWLYTCSSVFINLWSLPGCMREWLTMSGTPDSSLDTLENKLRTLHLSEGQIRHSLTEPILKAILPGSVGIKLKTCIGKNVLTSKGR